ncbi:coiled-coil domain-containing protein [Serratia ureilytica]|uniref:coiled-coil domain-containing protein n=1 Tax=Serratia ureilytica TaxID=300181 RepID=UPI001F476940|nr:hypothetical protein [Serratia ureilytica]
MENIKSDIEKAFRERMTGPLGYITASFLAYNWSWFYFVLFSSKSAEVKISSVINGFPKLSGFGWPIVAGLLIQVGAPYLKLLTTYLTSLAKNIENRVNHKSENYLNIYIEETNQLLADKRLEVTSTNAKIDSLIEQRDSINNEMNVIREKIINLRAEELSIGEKIESAARELHKLEMFLSEKNITKENFEHLLESLREKSIENTNTKNAALCINRNNTKLINLISRMEKHQEIINEHDKIELNMLLADLNEINSLINGTITTKDSAYFDDSKMVMIIPHQVPLYKVEDFLSTLHRVGYSASLDEIKSNGEKIVKFEAELMTMQKREIISHYEDSIARA